MVDWRSPPPDFLPGVLATIARRVSMDAALRVAAHWSGRRHIRAVIGRDHELARLIGVRAAQLVADILRDEHPDGRVTIPNAASQRRWLAIARLYAGRGWSVGAIARETQMDRRHVERIVAGITRDAPAAGGDHDHDHDDFDAPCAWCGHKPKRRRSAKAAGPAAAPRQLSLLD